MRVIVYGVGAIGGTVAVALARAGLDVLGVSRGAQLEAIRNNGLTLSTSKGNLHASVPVVGHPGEISFGAQDFVLLTMKSQDTEAALTALRDAGVDEQPIFCAQNGVANERMAARFFPNVHGVAVMMPATFVEPGRVAVHVAPRYGVFDVGVFPSGSREADTALASVLTSAGVAAFVQPDVMASKYGKLLLNLGNVLEAILGFGVDRGDLPERLRIEALRVYDAAGIAWRDVGKSDPRRDALIAAATVVDTPRVGSSTTQSLLRGTERLETDWLNGEIVLLGRIHGVPTPLNAALTDMGAALSRGDLRSGDLSPAELRDGLGVS